MAGCIGVLVTVAYWQYAQWRRKDIIHAMEMEEAAKRAQAASEAKSPFFV